MPRRECGPTIAFRPRDGSDDHFRQENNGMHDGTKYLAVSLVHDDAHKVDGILGVELLHNMFAMDLDRSRTYS